MITAQEAYRIGLVNEVVPHGSDHARRGDLKQIFANASGRDQVLARGGQPGPGDEPGRGHGPEASLFGLCAGTEDKDEGTQAFLQKRAAKFKAGDQ